MGGFDTTKKVNDMTRIISRSKGETTIEDMNELAKFLLNNGFAATNTEETGFQESSQALCDYEVHVVKKRPIRTERIKYRDRLGLKRKI